jgi:hypothetical protein
MTADRMTPSERAEVRGRLMYRDKNDRADSSLLFAQQTSAKARTLARELRRSGHMRKRWDPDEIARVRGLIREATENITDANDNLTELERNQ